VLAYSAGTTFYFGTIMDKIMVNGRKGDFFEEKGDRRFSLLY